MRKIINILLIVSLFSTVLISCDKVVNDPIELNGIPINAQNLKEPISSLLECPENMEINEFNLILTERANNLVTALNKRAGFSDEIIALMNSTKNLFLI